MSRRFMSSGTVSDIGALLWTSSSPPKSNSMHAAPSAPHRGSLWSPLRTWALLALALSALGAPASATQDLSLARLFGDGMVLQRGAEARIWGRARPGATVIVRGEWSAEGARAGEEPRPYEEAQAVADESGRWSVLLPTPKAGSDTGARFSARSGDGEVTVRNVLIGEVWFCSGQSNMEWELKKSILAARNRSGLPADVLAPARPNIRYFKARRRASAAREDDLDSGEWRPVEGSAGLDCTAVGYFFGVALQDALDVPIGLIDATWGGTRAEAWTPLDEVKSIPRHAASLDAAREGSTTRHTPSALWNGMVAPIAPFSRRGVIWYQGEANREHATEYATLFPLLIRAWRREFGAPELPFYFAQIAPYDYGDSTQDDDNLGMLRLAQTAALELPATGMAVTADVGNPADIHPKNKWAVGARLALHALHSVYGVKGVVAESPAATRAVPEGKLLRVEFKNAAGGLEPRGELLHFEVSQDGLAFHPASARIGEDGSTVVLESKFVENPRAARYLWSDSAGATLFGGTGLPAAPFRVDAP